MRAAAAAYMLSVARSKCADLVSVSRHSRLSPAERQTLFRLAWAEWGEDSRFRQEAWYAIRSLREAWFSLALDLMRSVSPVQFSDSLEAMISAIEQDTYLRNPHVRGYLVAFEPWPRSMGPFRQQPRSERRLPTLPHWTVRASEEFKRVLRFETRLQDFIEALGEA